MSSARPRGRVFMMLAIVVILLGLIQSPPLYRESIPGTLVTFDMVLVSGGQMKPFYIGRTEVTWDLYDVYALGLDNPPATGGADAIARPSQPYGAPDQGWGHAGYPAIGVTRNAADAFCRWLSTKTGKTYRLPTEAEWAEAAALAAGSSPPSSARLSELAWHRGNAGGRAHPVGTKVPDAIGLSDLFGNAAEWVAGSEGPAVVRGGSHRDPVSAVGPSARQVQDPSWNERDPQLPKSRWWLSDAPFVGFRIVREIGH